MTSQSVAFDRAAEYSDRTRGFPPGVAQPAAALMVRLGGLTAESYVLEVGVGTGRIALPVAPYVRAYYGIDLARPMLDKMVAKQKDEPIYPVLGDGKFLPFADASFDAVTAVHIFHLIPGYEAVLDEIVRVLKPGGVLLNGGNRGEETNDMDSVWNDKLTELGAPTSSSPDTMPREKRATFLFDAGWQLQADEHISYTYELSPLEHLDALRARMFSRQWSIPDDIHDASIVAVENYIAQNNIDLTQPRTINSSFQVQTFRPPAG